MLSSYGIHLQLQFALDDGYEAIGDDGYVDLYLDSILAGIIEFLDAQMLF